MLDNNGERVKLKNGNFKTYKVDLMDWNNQTKAEEWRAAWVQSVNKFLERNEHAERVDHRSFERQGIEQVPTVHMGVAATQMERRGIETELGNMNRVIAGINRGLWQLWAQIIRLKDRLKEALTPVAHSNKEEKPSIMAQLNQYKKEIKETKESIKEEPLALAKLRVQRDRALENLKRVDRRLKNANGVEKFDNIIVEKRKAYNEYSALKAEVKKAETSSSKKKPRSRDWER